MKKTLPRKNSAKIRVNPGFWAGLLSLLYFAFFSYTSYFMYKNLLYTDQDLAIHAQTLWNLVHGSGFSSILGVHFFANHFIPIFYLLRYFYFFFQTPLFLLILQSLALGSGVFLSYRVARHFLEPSWASLIALAYFFYPSVGHTNLYEFHQTTLAVPFLFLMILSYIESRFSMFMIWSILAMSFQENLPLAVFMFSVIAFLDKKKKIWVIAPSSVAVIWLYAAVVKIQPAFNKGTIEFMSIYSHLGHSLPEIVISLLTKPQLWIQAFFSAGSLTYLIELFLPLLLLPFLGWRFCLLTLPFLIQHLLSSREMERSVFYHYATEMIPFFIVATAMGMRIFLERYSIKLFRLMLILSFVVSFFVTTILISPFTRSGDQLEKFKGSHLLEFQHHLLKKIPVDAAVVSTLKFLPSLSQRKELYSFHHVYMGTYTLSLRTYVLPKTVEYALLDMNDAGTFHFKSESSPDNFKEFFSKSPWQVVDFAEDTILFKKGKKNLDALYQVNPPNLKPPDLKLEADLNGEIRLEGVTIQMGSEAHEGHAQLKFYWKCLKKPTKNYGMTITLVDSKGNTFYEYRRHLCYRLYPTSEWNEGDTVVENYWFMMPSHVPQGAIEVRVGPLDIDKMEVYAFTSKLEGKIDQSGRVKLETFEPY